MAEYTTIAKVKEDLGITSTSFDGILNKLVKSATGFVNLKIFGKPGHTLEQKSYTEKYDILETPENNIVFLEHRPIVSISSVSLSGSALAATDYYIYEEEGRVVLNFPVVGRQILEIQYTAGYKIDFSNENDTNLHNLPSEIEEVTRLLVVERWNEKGSAGIKQENVGSFSRTFKTANEKSNDHIREILNYYSKISI